MPYDFLLAIVVGVIALLLLVFRINASIVFFSLCAGSVLNNQVGGEASLFISSFIKNGDTSRAITSIGLILLPAIFSALIVRKSISANKLLANIVPSIAAGCLVVLLLVPFIPGGLQNQLTDSISWEYLERFEPLVLVIGMLSSVLLLWLSKDKTKKDKKHKK